MSKATKVNMKDASDFKMLDRKAVDSILSMPERNMFFRATSTWVGYKTTSVGVRGTGERGRRFQVVSVDTGKICIYQYCGIYYISIAVCHY